MFEGYTAEICVKAFPHMLMGAERECHTCADMGARTPIGVSGNSFFFSLKTLLFYHKDGS